MNSQPVPNVDFDDVDRVLNREFAAVQRDQLRALIDQSDLRDDARAVLACLKVADGDLLRAEDALKPASRDRRDVIAAAEYPNYVRMLATSNDLSTEDRQRIWEKDWDEYSTWLCADRPSRRGSGS